MPEQIKKTIIRPRHSAAIKKMLENVGADKEAFEGLNYSESYIKSGRIKNTKSWKELAETVLPDQFLLERNRWLLTRKQWAAVAAGLDKAYRAKKIYTNGVEIHNKYSGKTREELEELVARRVKRILENN